MVTQSIANTLVGSAPPPQSPEIIPGKPEGFDYAYVAHGKTHGCTQQELISAVKMLGGHITLVWTPETSGAVRPSQIDFLVSTLEQTVKRNARKTILVGLAIMTVGLVVTFLLGQWQLVFRNIFLVMGALVVVEGLWGWHKARSFTFDEANANAEAERFASSMTKSSPTGFTLVVIIAIALVAIAQLLAGGVESINLAGLVKPAVWHGELWRIPTATLMHVNFTHLWMNVSSLYYLGRGVEQTGHRRFVPVVFLLSGICGAVFSVVLYPHTTSVGASGGIMGLLGFMIAEVWLHREKYPRSYLRRLIEALVFTGVLGLLGFAFIDNAAHLGGVAAGFALGVLLLRRDFSGRGLRWLSNVSVALLLLISMFAANKLVKFW
jgi:membrane associated rhomboid family serine protease